MASWVCGAWPCPCWRTLFQKNPELGLRLCCHYLAILMALFSNFCFVSEVLWDWGAWTGVSGGCRGAAKHTGGQACRHSCACLSRLGAVWLQCGTARSHQIGRGNRSCSCPSGRPGGRSGSPRRSRGRTPGEQPAGCQFQEPIPAVSTQILNLLPKFQGSACRGQAVNIINKSLPRREYTWALP